jgi:chaperonin cofactor prefoldin
MDTLQPHEYNFKKHDNEKLNDDIIEQMLSAMELMNAHVKRLSEQLEALQVRLAKVERTLQNLCESMIGDDK